MDDLVAVWVYEFVNEADAESVADAVAESVAEIVKVSVDD